MSNWVGDCGWNAANTATNTNISNISPTTSDQPSPGFQAQSTHQQNQQNQHNQQSPALFYTNSTTPPGAPSHDPLDASFWQYSPVADQQQQQQQHLHQHQQQSQRYFHQQGQPSFVTPDYQQQQPQQYHQHPQPDTNLPQSSASTSHLTLDSGLVIPVARTRQAPSPRASPAPSSRRHSPKSRMGPKRQSNSVSNASGTPNKSQKTDDPQEFSRSVQKKLLSSTRTGQACDRCKIRKIRCDGLQGGCSPCIQNSTECRTTDRITGVAVSRGYVQNLEMQNQDMAKRIVELEERLTSLGVDVKPTVAHLSAGSADGQSMQWSHSAGQQAQWPASTTPSLGGGQNNFASDRPTDPALRQQETNLFRALPVFRTGSCGENYLGVSSGNSRVSSINGTSLSLLGMEIDIADFPSSDMDEPPPSYFQPGLYNKSYQSLLQTMYNINPKVEKPALPLRTEGLTYADWYFRVLNPYLPILHRPSFLTLLTRMYDDPTFRPSAAEIVMVHMTFAIMFFQYAARNFEDATQQADLNSKSNMHYHYALGFFYDLRASHTLQDIQALALICSHLRNFPKPGASWHLTNATLAHAIEQGLHRSSKRWAQYSEPPNPLEEEMRKRVFHCVLTMHVLLSGKLGRPMAIRHEDIDIEMPEPIDDEYISETHIAASRPNPCSFQIGIEGMKVQHLSLRLYASLYSIKQDPAAYEETVRRLESDIIEWHDNLPPQFKDESQPSQESRVFALYTKMWYFEYRLLLRHPAISSSTSKGFNNDSLDICVDCATCMLETVKVLQKYKSLDTTWYNGAVYLMAITVTLFVAFERQNSGNPMDLTKLRYDMNSWLDIMGEVGVLLGSGMRLQETVRIVTDGTLSSLERNAGRTTSTSRHTSRSPDPNHHSLASRKGSLANQFSAADATSKSSGAYLSPSATSANTSPAFSNPATFAYHEPSSGHTANHNGNPYTSNPDGPYADPSPPPAHAELNPTSLASVAAAANLAAAAHAAAGFDPHVFTTDATSSIPIVGTEFGSLAWRQWAGNMAGNLEPSDAHNEPANALMSLRDLTTNGGGGGDGQQTPTATMVGLGAHHHPHHAQQQQQHGDGAIVGPGDVTAVAAAVQQQQQPWPLMVFDVGSEPDLRN